MALTSSFKIELGQEVIINEVCEVGKVVERKDSINDSPKYKVQAYSAIDKAIDEWLELEELTV